ncbi:ethanolamine ammonia-lyase subunit EutC [Immundisolibacter sp.]|uniref:ethanolamine ammonia-lyase subunit EutC n=1 Tax=Immundisolibacter sp. TaxID=1934948 RepID=UPI00260B10AD|nr:ethanolamine ammonia-lyase subunit EutC [Immundisolibacter sp.]MDD3650449.1 ethanolamine ammonia-lyase subunit EutC [Immundisolibacter sp.]
MSGPIESSPAVSTLVQDNPWQALRRHTAARIALGRVGASLPTDEVLRFGLAHAQARDAVLRPLDCEVLQRELAADGWRVLRARSQAPGRRDYLLRPDLGRRLREADRAALAAQPAAAELAIVVADGLSSCAVQQHVRPLLAEFRSRFDTDWENTPLVLVEQGRVAIGDDIGAALGAQLVVVLIGERPGLSSPASLSIYLTFAPRPGRTDGERNCISNVRPQGLDYPLAAHKLAYLCRAALRLQLTGVGLKDDSDLGVLPG